MADFIETQKAFVSAIKQPDGFSTQNEDQARRMAIYQSLFFNNVDGFVSSAFPVLKSLYSDSQWQSLIKTFFASHHCRSPYFAEISKEFVEFLDGEYELTEQDPPFIKELAHYEWLELDVSIRKSNQTSTPYTLQSLPQSVTVSELATVVSYTYPVHQIQSDYQPDSPLDERVYFVVYRDEDDDVQFMQVNALTAFLLSHIESSADATIEVLLNASLEVMPGVSHEVVSQGLEQTLLGLLHAGILLPSC